jgi:hypothetical protein
MTSVTIETDREKQKNERTKMENSETEHLQSILQSFSHLVCSFLITSACSLIAGYQFNSI